MTGGLARPAFCSLISGGQIDRRGKCHRCFHTSTTEFNPIPLPQTAESDRPQTDTASYHIISMISRRLRMKAHRPISTLTRRYPSLIHHLLEVSTQALQRGIMRNVEHIISPLICAVLQSHTLRYSDVVSGEVTCCVVCSFIAAQPITAAAVFYAAGDVEDVIGGDVGAGAFVVVDCCDVGLANGTESIEWLCGEFDNSWAVRHAYRNLCYQRQNCL